ncbi:hypothetical protein F8155_26395 [Priestia endophytica]|nr:TetR/AcrR family transcriptional regulator C-terminal domain-containing protein [Priestia endophytica]KAB2486586.1 hypothetical protein F8155_26395 [Priestia endophytica]
MAELALTTVPVGSHSSAIIEYILKQLDLGSIRSTSAAWGADLLLLYTTSVAYEQTSRNQKGQDSTLISTYFHSLEGSQYPMISSMKKEIFSGESERFQWGIEAVLQGISVLKDGKKPLN